MIDKRQYEIKERLQRYAMDLWGISDPRQIDPVVGLILEVFAYNSSRLYQDIDIADAAILHRLSRLLVPQKWSLPYPAHGLMSVNPSEDNTKGMTIEDSFFTDKMIFEKGLVRLFFSPLSNYPLVRAKVKSMAYDHKLISYAEDGRQMPPIAFDAFEEESGTVWIGLEAKDSILQELDNLVLCILPESEKLISFVKDIKAYDVKGNPMAVSTPTFPLEHKEKYHYFDDISDYYSDHYISIDFAEHKERGCLKCTQGPEAWEFEDTSYKAEELCWIKLKFPYTYSEADLNNIRILTNTFPVVNRQTVERKHSFDRLGTIIPIPCSDGMYLLNMESLQDNTGKFYTDIQSHYEEHPTAAFSLFFGNLEKFDSDNARSLIIRLMQLIREDGSAFMSVNTSLLSAQLSDIFQKLDDLSQNVYDAVHKGSKSRAFLLAIPQKNAKEAEIKYWVTDGETANGLDYRAPLYLHGSSKYQNTGICFQTVTIQGTVHNNDQDLINSLRYGLLSKDRIVTKEDVRSYIYHKIGTIVKDVKIQDGIMISPDVRKGIVRTTEVRIKTRSHATHDTNDLASTALFLEKELSKRSISNTPYKIFFE